MSVLCPQGHASETTDFCDQCGREINGALSEMVVSAGDASTNGTPRTAVADGSVTSEPLPSTKTCPNCHAPNAEEDRFCESCGHDFRSDAASTAPPALQEVQAWEATVVADRAYYDRLDANGIPFPAVCPERRFMLSGQRLVIGRRSVSRGIHPEVDLSGPPEDVGVSHLHAILVGTTGGGWAIIDPGSANGTFVNDGADPIPTNQAVELSEGDQIHVGAWTTLKLSATSGS